MAYVTSTTSHTFVVDGIDTGALRLSHLSVLAMPSYATCAWVISVGDWFDLVPVDSTTQPKPLVTILTPDGRQWRRRGTPNQTFLQAKYWSVGPGGSDEARGWGNSHTESDAVKLATMWELNRRLTGWDGSQPGWYSDSFYGSLPGPSIHLTGSIDKASFAVLTNLTSATGGAFPRMYADLVPVDLNRTISVSQPAVPATNTERMVTIPGLGLKPEYVNKALVSANGRKFAWITRQTGADLLSLSEVRTVGNASDWLAGGGTSIGNFANNDVVSVYDLAVLPDWPYPPGAKSPYLARVQLGTPDTSYYAHGDMGASTPWIYQVRFGDPNMAREISYEIFGGHVDTGGYGVIIQPSFVGNHNSIHGARWFLQSPAFIQGVASPFWFDDCVITFGGEANFSGRGGLPLRCNFPEQNSAQIASWGSTYLWGDFNMAAGSHHGGMFADIYMDDDVKWYGSIPGAAFALPAGSRVRLPVLSNITLVCPGAGTPNHPAPPGGQIILNVGGVLWDRNPRYKNFSDVPFFDTVSGTSVTTF